MWYNLGLLIPRYTVYTSLKTCPSGPQHALQCTADLAKMINLSDKATVRMRFVVFVAWLCNEVVWTDWRCDEKPILSSTSQGQLHRTKLTHSLILQLLVLQWARIIGASEVIMVVAMHLSSFGARISHSFWMVKSVIRNRTRKRANGEKLRSAKFSTCLASVQAMHSIYDVGFAVQRCTKPTFMPSRRGMARST